jgi:hypothetical protein
VDTNISEEHAASTFMVDGHSQPWEGKEAWTRPIRTNFPSIQENCSYQGHCFLLLFLSTFLLVWTGLRLFSIHESGWLPSLWQHNPINNSSYTISPWRFLHFILILGLSSLICRRSTISVLHPSNSRSLVLIYKTRRHSPLFIKPVLNLEYCHNNNGVLLEH